LHDPSGIIAGTVAEISAGNEGIQFAWRTGCIEGWLLPYIPDYSGI
jgi:hypothetical protein